MSFLTDEPLTPQEERAIDKAEFNYSRKYTYSPKTLQQLPIPVTSNKPVPDTDTINGEHAMSDYFKIDIRNNQHCILLNTSIYVRLARMIKYRYGHYPLHNSLICTSITIIPQPNKRCTLYYSEGQNSAGEQPTFEKIASFVGKFPYQKLSIGCPYTDSLTDAKHVAFNWFHNNKKTGTITPIRKTTDYYLPSDNTNLPWICADPYGSFFIDGISDAVGFNVTFIGSSGWGSYRNTPMYNRAFYVRNKRRAGLYGHRKHRTHVSHMTLGEPGEIQWEIPSREVSEYDDYDPLLDLLQ